MSRRIMSGLMALALCALIGRPAIAAGRPLTPSLGYALAGLPQDLTLSWKPAAKAVAQIDDVDCLTAAVYYEARSEPAAGQRAVAAVVLNRVARSFAPNICGVVHQRTRGTCQFSFVCNGATRARKDERAWEAATRVAHEALSGFFTSAVGSATFYHSVAVSPDWSGKVSRVATIGRHIFYR
jgi:spore germination cell wall hydrolase CwlJ-like protein